MKTTQVFFCVTFVVYGMTVETSLEYELTPFPLSLFSNKDHAENKQSKQGRLFQY